jgi:hypothetical protein
MNLGKEKFIVHLRFVALGWTIGKGSDVLVNVKYPTEMQKGRGRPTFGTMNPPFIELKIFNVPSVELTAFN